MANKITCTLMGGLGNQMFQIFATIAFALDNEFDFVFPNFGGMRGVDGVSKRPAYWNSLFINLQNKIENVNNLMCLNEQQDFIYKKFPTLDKTKNYKLNGYFQHINYFNTYSKEIITYLGLETFQNNILQKCSHINFKNTISLHFRIGDYKVCSHYHPIIKVDYYKKALQNIILETNKKDWDVHYCCEEQDIERVKEHINTLKEEFPEIIFSRIDNTLEDWEQMLYMSVCCHNIIANSTFSWWSAYLNKNENQIVYRPSSWFHTSSAPGLTLENWKTISY